MNQSEVIGALITHLKVTHKKIVTVLYMLGIVVMINTDDFYPYSCFALNTMR